MSNTEGLYSTETYQEKYDHYLDTLLGVNASNIRSEFERYKEMLGSNLSFGIQIQKIGDFSNDWVASYSDLEKNFFITFELIAYDSDYDDTKVVVAFKTPRAYSNDLETYRYTFSLDRFEGNPNTFVTYPIEEFAWCLTTTIQRKWDYEYIVEPYTDKLGQMEITPYQTKLEVGDPLVQTFNRYWAVLFTHSNSGYAVQELMQQMEKNQITAKDLLKHDN